MLGSDKPGELTRFFSFSRPVVPVLSTGGIKTHRQATVATAARSPASNGTPP